MQATQTIAAIQKNSAGWRAWAPRHAAIIVVILMAAGLAGAGINQYVFWDDEASTALFARALMRSGSLDAWDGRNVNSFQGGINLDEHLRSREGIPLQHYVAAAGMEVLGEATWAARLPFLLVGLATLWLLSRWAWEMFGTAFPAWLPALLLAGNVPYLLYIIQCRYYALVMGFSVALLWAWSYLDRGHRWLAYAGGATAAFGLVLSNPLDGIAMVAACAVGSLHPRFRGRSHILFVGMIGVVVMGVTLHLLTTADALESWQSRRGASSFAEHFATLMVLQFKGLGAYEFLPLLVLPLLVLPWIWRRLAHLRPIAVLALTALAMILAVLTVVAMLSPQDLGNSQADMRYVLPVLVIGPVVTAATVTVAAAGLGRATAALIVVGIILTNLPYGARPLLQCTICERIHELGEPHPSGSDAVVNIAKMLPPGARTVFVPNYLTLPAMFYRPDLRYAAMLDPKKTIDPDLRRILPDYIFQGGAAVDILVIGIGSIPLSDPIHFAGSQFQLAWVSRTYWVDRTRPEIPPHQFRADPANDQAFGIAVFRRVQ